MKYCLTIALATLCLFNWSTSLTADYERRHDDDYDEWNEDNHRHDHDEDRHDDDENRRRDEERRREEERRDENRNNKNRGWFSGNR